jgi:pentatricopeptide repeat protein
MNTLLTAMVRTNMISDARKLYDEMVVRGICDDFYTGTLSLNSVENVFFLQFYLILYEDIFVHSIIIVGDWGKGINVGIKKKISLI